MSRSSAIIWAVVIVVLGWVNLGVVQKERLITNGDPVLLDLAPVDPRSLIQGDYMVLRYAITDAVDDGNAPRTGTLVVRRDGRGIATFVRLHNEQQPLASDELLIRFRRQDGRTFIGAESFFFQEGHAPLYENARYAELRVDTTGETILIGLRGPNLEQLQPPPNDGVFAPQNG